MLISTQVQPQTNEDVSCLQCVTITLSNLTRLALRLVIMHEIPHMYVVGHLAYLEPYLSLHLKSSGIVDIFLPSSNTEKPLKRLTSDWQAVRCALLRFAYPGLSPNQSIRFSSSFRPGLRRCHASLPAHECNTRIGSDAHIIRP